MVTLLVILGTIGIVYAFYIYAKSRSSLFKSCQVGELVVAVVCWILMLGTVNNLYTKVYKSNDTVYDGYVDLEKSVKETVEFIASPSNLIK